MSTRSIFRSLARAALLGALAFFRLDAQATVQGSITGRVTDAATGQPIASAQVNVVNTSIGTLTNDQGQYILRGVSAGTPTCASLRVGFAEQRRRGDGHRRPDDDARRRDARRGGHAQSRGHHGDRRAASRRGRQLDRAGERGEGRARRAPSPTSATCSRRARRACMVIPGTQTGAGTRIRIRGTELALALEQPDLHRRRHPRRGGDGLLVDERRRHDARRASTT